MPGEKCRAPIWIVTGLGGGRTLYIVVFPRKRKMLERKNKIKNIKSPTQLPNNETMRGAWQRRNKSWWEVNPMRYDWRQRIPFEPNTPAYFKEIDRRFFESVHHYMPWQRQPFDNLIDFESLKNKDVLEIGVGQGSHAELIAPSCKSYTGIDLTERASSTTDRRLRLAGISSRILCMDAENMGLRNESFDFIWSWGVIHHSANTLNVLKEMHRVLKPGGVAVVMVYHRTLLNYYIFNGIIRGILRGDLSNGGLHGVNQAATDGAIARFYRPHEWAQLCLDLFSICNTSIFGQKSEILPVPSGRLKDLFVKMLPDFITRFFTNDLKMGSLLVVTMKRI